MEHVDQYKVKHGWRGGVEADFEQVVVVWRDTETRHKAVHHQIHVLTAAVLTARERLRSVEQKRLAHIYRHAHEILIIMEHL